VTEQKGPASSGVISLAIIKALHQSSSLTYPKQGAKEKLSEEAKPKVFRFIQTCRQIEIHTQYTSS
jgi:hypothetical protein